MERIWMRMNYFELIELLAYRAVLGFLISMLTT
jgi:hypothetical protein